MEMREWLLLGAVIVVPLAIAVVVTLWTLEQAIKRNAKNRGGKKVRRVAVATDDGGAGLVPPAGSGSSGARGGRGQDPDRPDSDGDDAGAADASAADSSGGDGGGGGE
jgi:hypothetical protein